MKHRTPSQYPLVRAISERELPLSNNVADMAAWRGRGRETDDVRRARIRARKKRRALLAEIAELKAENARLRAALELL